MKLPKTKICAPLLLFCFASAASKFRCSRIDPKRRLGHQTLGRAGKVEFSLIESHHGGRSSHESDWPLERLSGPGHNQGRTPGRALHHRARCGKVRV